MSMTNTWKRIKGEGYDLIGTDYGVRTEVTGYSTANAENGGYGEVAGREYAVVRLSTDENIDWFDRCRDAKNFAEQLAARDAAR